MASCSVFFFFFRSPPHCVLSLSFSFNRFTNSTSSYVWSSSFLLLPSPLNVSLRELLTFLLFSASCTGRVKLLVTSPAAVLLSSTIFFVASWGLPYSVCVCVFFFFFGDFFCLCCCSFLFSFLPSTSRPCVSKKAYPFSRSLSLPVSLFLCLRLCLWFF